jgi:cation diffusion facilitator CzcD-associated flavoprotein CzcO
MQTSAASPVAQPGDAEQFDVIVVGAGFAGLYALHKLRSLGLRVRVLELADQVGGTWLWNRYPGARCDIESIEYSYSFSEVIQQEWEWTELLPAQPEIEAYLNFVADRLDLRRDIQFNALVIDMAFDEAQGTWTLTTEPGPRYTAHFVVAATGILSVPKDPDIPGKDEFGGESLYCSRFPREGFDFTGKRVGIIGTGSTGVQATPVVAEQAAHLSVFQRSAAYTLPSNARPFAPGELDDLKANYAGIRRAQLNSRIGAARLSAFSVTMEMMKRPPIKHATREEQLHAIEERGLGGALYWGDVTTDFDASDMARKLYGEAIARIVRDPRTAASLVPTYPFGCKRPIIDQGYYEAFNRSNVSLVDLRADPMVAVTASGIRTEGADHDLDVIVYATGFDAMTGALTRIDIRGRGGALLREVWAADGPMTYLGLQVAGFPNLFTIQGPGSPAVASNFVTALEQHVDWIADCLMFLRAQGYQEIEALRSAQAEWSEHTASLIGGSVLTHPSCTSWWNGGNIPGKKRVFMGYVGGIPEYRRRCDAVAAAGYAGFALTPDAGRG